MIENYHLWAAQSATVLFVVLVLAAAVLDAWKFIIPNSIVVSLVGLFLVVALISPYDANWIWRLGITLGVFAVVTVGFATKVIGGGDAKLMTALALWTGQEFIIEYLFLTALAGGVVTAVVYVSRRGIFAALVMIFKKADPKLPRLLVVGEPIPYGVAIAAGALFLVDDLPHLAGKLDEMVDFLRLGAS